MVQAHAPSTAAALRFERLGTLTAAISGAVTFQRVARVVAEGAAEAAGADGAVLAILDEDEEALRVVERFGYPEAAAPPSRIPLDEPSPLTAAAASRAPAFVESPVPGGGTWAALPLTVRNRTIGALGLVFRGPLALDDESRAFLLALAGQAALAIERAQLHEMESALRAEAEAEHERFRSLVQELDAIFWEADARTHAFTFVSRRAEPILGHPTERWLREAAFWEGLLHPEDRAWTKEFRRACAKDGRDHTIEYRALAADGRTVWLRDVAYVVRDSLGHPVRMRGVMMDVTREREGRDERVARAHGPPPRGSGFLPAARRLLSLGGAGGAQPPKR